MLEKATFKNFKSFTKETVISLVPTKSEILTVTFQMCYAYCITSV